MDSLLIVDMQKGFINKHDQFLIKNIENLLNSHKFDNVFATKFINRKNSIYDKFLNWNKMRTKSEQEFAISLPKTAKVFEKTSYALNEKDLQFLKQKCGGGILICGMDYDACVLAIAFQLFDNGIKPKFVLNCVGSHSKNPIKKRSFKKICLKNFGKDSLIRL